MATAKPGENIGWRKAALPSNGESETMMLARKSWLSDGWPRLWLAIFAGEA